MSKMIHHSANSLTHTSSFANTFHVSIFMLTLITAGAHLYLSAQLGEELHYYFLLNGLGYFTLLTAFLLPQVKSFHHIIRWALLGYVLLTIILWFFFGSPHEGKLDPFDIMVKLVEVTLAIHLFLDYKQEEMKI